MRMLALIFCVAVTGPTLSAQSFSLAASSSPTNLMSATVERVDASPAGGVEPGSSSSVAEPLPAAPEPMMREREEVVPSGTWHQKPFSRVGIGADVTLLGVGLKAAIVLNHYFDARLNGAYFNYSTAPISVTDTNPGDQFNFSGTVHLASLGAALDWYPLGNVWRVSPGVMLYNGNQFSGNGTLSPGTSFSFNSQTYYSANPTKVPGATPLAAVGTLGLHTNQPALTLTTGFGKFLPHSERHWSFPFEVGAIYTGAPSLNVVMTGWACTDAAEKHCANVGDTTTPIGHEFNADLQSQLTSWRNSAKHFPIYPIFSYGVMYSFDIR